MKIYDQTEFYNLIHDEIKILYQKNLEWHNKYNWFCDDTMDEIYVLHNILQNIYNINYNYNKNIIGETTQFYVITYNNNVNDIWDIIRNNNFIILTENKHILQFNNDDRLKLIECIDNNTGEIIKTIINIE